MKHLNIITGGNLLYTVLTDEMKKRVSKDSVLLMGKKSDYKQLEMRPFYSKYYVVEVITDEMSGDYLKRFGELMKLKHIQFIFINSTFENYEELNKFNDIIKFNGYRPPASILDKFILDRLNKDIAESTFNSFKSRLRGNYSLLEMFIEVLNSVEEDKITMGKLSKLVPNLNQISFRAMMFSIIERKNKEKVFSLLDEYRYGNKFVKEKLLEELDVILEEMKKDRTDSVRIENISYMHSIGELLWIKEKLTKCRDDRLSLFKTVYQIMIRRE